MTTDNTTTQTPDATPAHTAAVVPANLAPLSMDEAKPGLRVILIQGDESGAIRGKIVSKTSGWLSVRFDDGVTRMARAKTLAKDTSPVIQFVVPQPKTQKAPKPPVVAQQPVGRAPKMPKAAKIKAAKPVKAAKAPKVAKVGQPCLCACGDLANPGRAFRQGHDARFHGWMRRLADERLLPSEVPAAALRLMNLNKDGVPTTDYDGSPWKA